MVLIEFWVSALQHQLWMHAGPFIWRNAAESSLSISEKRAHALAQTESSLRTCTPWECLVLRVPLVFCHLQCMHCASLVLSCTSGSILFNNQSGWICLTKTSQAFTVEGQHAEGAVFAVSAETPHRADCVVLPLHSRALLAANPKGTAPPGSLCSMFSNRRP